MDSNELRDLYISLGTLAGRQPLCNGILSQNMMSKLIN
jgi:hypothetical protein